MVQRFEYDFGSGEYHPNFVVFESARGVEIDEEKAGIILKNCKAFYKDKPYGFISYRNDLQSKRGAGNYKLVKPKELIAIAVVAEANEPTPNIYEEQKLYNGPFSYFRHIDEAQRWMDSFFDGFKIEKPIQLNYDFGEAVCHQEHLIFTTYENAEITKKTFRIVAKDLREIYSKKDFSFIVNRRNNDTVHPAVYKMINKQPIKGFGIIGKHKERVHMLKSLELLKMPVGYFSSEEEAVSWVETLD